MLGAGRRTSARWPTPSPSCSWPGWRGPPTPAVTAPTPTARSAWSARFPARARTHDGDPSLLAAINQAAHRWYGDDANYPAGWEPNGGDFLSPALTEAELMSEVLQPAAFADWLDRFLPGLANGHPSSLFKPATVSDPTDGQIAHLHGLNLYRAYAYQQLTRTLPDTDPRGPVLRDAAAAMPRPHCPPWAAVTTWSNTGWPATPSCCSRERRQPRRRRTTPEGDGSS